MTEADIYNACQQTRFDIIHFATHGGPEGVELSGGVILDAESIAQICRIRETQELFFNSCRTGRLAAYAVRHGVRFSMCAEVDLPDNQAWKLPAAFYGARQSGSAKDLIGAYVLADSGDGEYALHINPEYLIELQRAAAMAAAMPHNALPLSRREAIMWAGALLAASTALATLINLWAGRF